VAAVAASEFAVEDHKLVAELNEGSKPRRGAFEIRVETDRGQVIEVRPAT